MYDAKYALEIMKHELGNKYISPEIRYAFKASVEALEKQSKQDELNKTTKEHDTASLADNFCIQFDDSFY